MLDHIQQGCHKTASTTLPPFPGLLDSWICHQSNTSRIIWDEIVEVEIGGVAIYHPFGEFRRAKSYCHLYGAQGQ
ncbi:hypothetical protein TNCV_2979521 [Trichonephila clavipes]|nr:hypothetical protein TNCV_2979521 [Trichonephila clavipes]